LDYFIIVPVEEKLVHFDHCLLLVCHNQFFLSEACPVVGLKLNREMKNCKTLLCHIYYCIMFIFLKNQSCLGQRMVISKMTKITSFKFIVGRSVSCVFFFNMSGLGGGKDLAVLIGFSRDTTPCDP
ncbi:hypothetical protein ACJX0J_038443, partial [Zea mays]